MYQRPKLNESDEDLLKLQEEFFKNKQKSDFKLAATLVSTKSDPSKPSASVESPSKNAENEDKKETEIQEHLDNTFEDIPKIIQIGNIVVKHNKPSTNYPQNKNLGLNLSKTGFPQAKRRDLSISTGKGSIFSQQMKKLKKENVPESSTSTATSSLPESMDIDDISNKISQNESKIENLPKNSNENSIITPIDSVKAEIHRENLDKMSKMSQEEILEEREKLMTTLDPAIVAFLKSKHLHNRKTVETRQPSIKEQNNAEIQISVDEISSAREVLNAPNAEKWIHFDVLEGNKLAWMQDVPKLEESNLKDKKYEARFDFGGWLLPFAFKEEEINDANRSLYHHGEDPGRPGYTLPELFQLSRSNVIQQKIVALNTIAAILNLHSTGIYDHIIDLPIEQIFFVLRFCLDENSPATLNAAIKAMRNLFCSTIDETCLDCLMGFALGGVQPILAVDEELDDPTVNDQQLAERNLVKCLFRSGILIRIRYIINVVKPSDIETISNCLDLLIRLGRDSQLIVEELIKFDGLIESIVLNFMPKVISQVQSTTAYGTPMPQAVKLMRILAARSDKMAAILLNKFNVLDSVLTYLSNDNLSLNTTGLKLQIEALYLWETLTFYEVSDRNLDYFHRLRSVLLQFCDYHTKNTNVDASWTMQTHLSAILSLLSTFCASSTKNYNFVLEFVKNIFENALPKWMTQFLHLSMFSCGKLQILSSLFNFLTNLNKFQPESVHLPWESVYGLVEKLITSETFKMATDNLKNSSNVLNNYELHKSSANLLFSEAVAWNTADHVIPVLNTTSCVPFLNKIAEFISISSSNKLQLVFLNDKNICSYLKSIQKSNLYLTSNWFTKMEADFILNTLKMAVQCQKELDTSIFYEVAVKSLCIFTPEMKKSVEYLFSHVIFCKTFYPTEVLLKNLHVLDEDTLKTAFEDIVNIQKVYVDVLGLQKDLVMFDTKRALHVRQPNIMPVDWIYSPIIALYSSNRPEKVAETAQNFIISNCLRWVYIYESYFPELANMINATDKFCRLCCTYLGSDTLFLLPEVQKLLRACLTQILTRHGDELDFDRAIHGLKSFQDLYTQLLEQYQAVSYGDKLFGLFLLIPLAQRHNVKFRKTIWSEYAGILQIFNLSEDEAAEVTNIQNFLEPLEEDASLLHCYQRTLARNAVRKGSVFHKIATHHVAAHNQRQREVKN